MHISPTIRDTRRRSGAGTHAGLLRRLRAGLPSQARASRARLLAAPRRARPLAGPRSPAPKQRRDCGAAPGTAGGAYGATRRHSGINAVRRAAARLARRPRPYLTLREWRSLRSRARRAPTSRSSAPARLRAVRLWPVRHPPRIALAPAARSAAGAAAAPWRRRRPPDYSLRFAPDGRRHRHHADVRRGVPDYSRRPRRRREPRELHDRAPRSASGGDRRRRLHCAGVRAIVHPGGRSL
jgi:hypothetical protein